MRRRHVPKPQPRSQPSTPSQGCTPWARDQAGRTLPGPAGRSPSGRGGAGGPRAPPHASSAGTRRTARGAGGPAPTPAARSAPGEQGHDGLRPRPRPGLLSRPHLWGTALTSRHRALNFSSTTSPRVTCQHRAGGAFPGVSTPTETAPPSSCEKHPVPLRFPPGPPAQPPDALLATGWAWDSDRTI